jgi:hypothetical protein
MFMEWLMRKEEESLLSQRSGAECLELSVLRLAHLLGKKREGNFLGAFWGGKKEK